MFKSPKSLLFSNALLILLSNRFHKLLILLENEFVVFNASEEDKWFHIEINNTFVWARLTRRWLAKPTNWQKCPIAKSIQNERSKMFYWPLNLLQKLNFRLLHLDADINRKLHKNFILEGFPASSGQFFEKLLLDFELWTFELGPRKYLNRPLVFFIFNWFSRN